MRALAFVVLLAGCSVDGRAVPDWILDAEGGPHGIAVTLPGNLHEALPSRITRYKLRTDVAVTRDAPVTLGIECFHGPISLSADGVVVRDTGDAPVGEHRFTFVPSRDAVSLELATRQDLGTTSGFGAVPMLLDGVVGGRGRIATFNRYAYLVEATLAATFGFLYGIMYLLDRRKREHGALALQGLGALALPLKLLGVLDPLGAAAPVILYVFGNATAIGLLYFVHDAYRLPPPHRAWWRIAAALSAAHLLLFVSFRASETLFPLEGVFTNAVFAYVVVRYVALARTRRVDALLLLLGVGIAAAGVLLEYVWLLTGHSVVAGVHTIGLSIVPVAIVQSIVLARQSVAREHMLEQTAEELRHQIVERSRELSEALARLSQPRLALEADRVIDQRYRVVRKLGSGGMGAVYEVERLADRQHLALKTLRGNADPAHLARFAREAQIAAQIHHPNLVPVVDVGIAEGGLYLVMPLVEGGSLEDHRERFGDAEWARPILAQVAVGVAALHARGIVHRDLKPGNVLLDGEVARIADFGLAALYDEVADPTVPSAGPLAATAVDVLPLTRVGDVFGTPAYMAPELAGGARDAPPSTDVFSFGVMACELLTGQVPFGQPPVLARLHGLPPPTARLDGVDPALARCLDNDPARRPTASELSELLS